MIIKKVAWNALKSFASAKQVGMQFFEDARNYEIYVLDGPLAVNCNLSKDSDDAEEFENNFKGAANLAIKERVSISTDQTPLNASDSTNTFRVNSAARDTELLAANPARRGFFLFNDSSQACYVLLGSGEASATNFSTKIAAGGYFQSQASPVYRGQVKAIWASADGAMRVTEFV